MFVRGKVDEADIGRVRLGQQARITTETFRDRVFEGRVTQISPIGVEKDNVTTFEVEVSIDNPGKELKANMTRQRRDRPRAVARFAARSRGARSSTTRSGTPSSTSWIRRAKTGRRRVPVKVGVGNGTRIQVLERREGRRQGRSPEAEVDASEVLRAGAVANLRANKLRSFLTMFGILWGVISVVVLVGHGRGFQRGNQHVLEELGKNVGIVWGGRTSLQAGGERAGPSCFSPSTMCGRWNASRA